MADETATDLTATPAVPTVPAFPPGPAAAANTFTYGLLALVLCWVPVVCLIFLVLTIVKYQEARRYGAVTTKTKVGLWMGISPVIIVSLLFAVIIIGSAIDGSL